MGMFCGKDSVPDGELLCLGGKIGTSIDRQQNETYAMGKSHILGHGTQISGRTSQKTGQVFQPRLVF